MSLYVRTSQELGKGDLTRHFEEKSKRWIKENQVFEETKEDRVETVPVSLRNGMNSEIHGFDNEIRSLENFLFDQKVDNEFKSLVIVGEYGVGKTALCQKMFNNEDVKRVYAPMIWISMHSNGSKEGLDGKISVLKRILNGLVLEEDMFESIHREEAGEVNEETAKEKELFALLCAVYMNLEWKKYLIVFDDVREEDNWNEKLDEKLEDDVKWGKHLSDGFPKGSGGRVIYTTRDENLAKKLVPEKHEIHRLWPLTDPQIVLRIYEAALFENDMWIDIPRNDKKCIAELMNKSRGIPLAIKLLGTLEPVFTNEQANTVINPNLEEKPLWT